jgi:hypothetical protein
VKAWLSNVEVNKVVTVTATTTISVTDTEGATSTARISWAIDGVGTKKGTNTFVVAVACIAVFFVAGVGAYFKRAYKVEHEQHVKDMQSADLKEKVLNEKMSTHIHREQALEKELQVMMGYKNVSGAMHASSCERS